MTEEIPALPAFHKGKPTEYAKVPTTHIITCPKCGRQTYIAKTEERREPYNLVGCFSPACGHIIP